MSCYDVRGLLLVLVVPKHLPRLLLIVGPPSIFLWERVTRTYRLLGQRQGISSMLAVSRERLTPSAAADAATPKYLRAMLADFHPT